MKLALDTSVYAALEGGHEPLAADIRRAERVGLPIIVLGELWFGFMNGSRLRQNSETLERFLATPRVQILQLDEQTAPASSERSPRCLEAKPAVAIQQNDIWIAALCKQHGFALATRDRGFHQVLGLEVIETPLFYSALASQQHMPPSISCEGQW